MLLYYKDNFSSLQYFQDKFQKIFKHFAKKNYDMRDLHKINLFLILKIFL